LSLEQKKTTGAQINSLRDSVDSLIKSKLLEIKKNEINSKLLNESIDISFPPPTSIESKVHPISKTFDEVIRIFGSMGYSVAEGPDIETDFYNFSFIRVSTLSLIELI
jgi:phenylalanyl-tRNA synthetase alpha chain